MHSIGEIHGFPPVISELEQFDSEVRQTFGKLRPALMGGVACYLLALAFAVVIK